MQPQEGSERGRWEVLRAWERGSPPFPDLVPSKGQRPPVNPSRQPLLSPSVNLETDKKCSKKRSRGNEVGVAPGTRPWLRSKRAHCTLLVNGSCMFLEQGLGPQLPDRFNHHSKNISPQTQTVTGSSLERQGPEKARPGPKSYNPAGQSCYMVPAPN